MLCSSSSAKLPQRPHSASGDADRESSKAPASALFDATRNARSLNKEKPTRAVEGTLEDKSDKEEIHKSLLFSRASNIIRESFEVEGCIFFDVTVGSYRSPPVAIKPDNPAATSSSDEQVSASPTEDPDVSCGILGFSTSKNSSINARKVTQQGWNLPKRFLAKLLRRYPGGKIFNFDASGELQSSDSSEGDRSAVNSADDELVSPVSGERGTAMATASDDKPKPRDKQSHRLMEGNMIYKAFKGARSVMFVPMWDLKRERWFAGGFAFTFTAPRVFTVENELSPFKAFANVMAAEFYSIETAQTSQAISDALGSLSHELRSPLHGVILATELLNDTNVTVFQGNAIHTIETCCRTLLDTIDHLLDYAKINSFAMSRKEKNNATSPALRRKAGADDFGKQQLYSSVRLAGFNFQRKSVKQLSREHSELIGGEADSHDKMDTAQGMEQLATPIIENDNTKQLKVVIGAVIVYVQVDPNVDWTFQLPRGAVRRIVLNLVGNSMKFTFEGSTRVSVTQERPPTSSTKRSRAKRIVKITVEDTGKGIADDYIQHRLFQPFAQENQLSSGTGLGLSFVKRIVSMLQGQVNLPLDQVPSNAEKSKEDSAFEEQMEELHGLRVRLNGFTQETNQPSIVEDICRDNLRLEVISQEQSKHLRPDVMLWSENALPDPEEDLSAYLAAPNVVLCQDALVAYHLAKKLDSAGHIGAFEFVSQP